MRKKKILVLSLCLCFIFSSIVYLSIGSANETMKKFKLNDQSVKSTSAKVVVKDLNKSMGIPVNNIPISINSGDGVLYQGKKESLQSGDPFQEDKYHIEKEELEDLMEKGHSIADIFKADEMGNRLNVDPKNLLEKKKEKNQKWEEIEKEVLKERAEKFLNKLKEKHPQEFEQLQAAGLSVEEQFTLLAMYDRHIVTSIEQLIDTYKQSGEEGLKNIFKNPKFYGKVSKEKMDKHGLTDKDVEGLSDEMIDRMEIISKKANVPVKKLIQGYHAKVREQQEVRAK